MASRTPRLGWTPEDTPDALIPYESVQRISKSYGLGNYADDVYQEMYLKLDNAKRQGKPSSKKYAFGILRNLLRDLLKKLDEVPKPAKRQSDLAESGHPELRQSSPEETAARKELITKVVDSIKGLTCRRRVVFYLRHYRHGKFTFREIGIVIGLSPSGARLEYSKALEYIRAGLTAEERAQLKGLKGPFLTEATSEEDPSERTIV
jgi:RNA polymerase sigma factor (sigma-70 family)